jgi:hypothetical protein
MLLKLSLSTQEVGLLVPLLERVADAHEGAARIGLGLLHSNNVQEHKRTAKVLRKVLAALEAGTGRKGETCP